MNLPPLAYSITRYMYFSLSITSKSLTTKHNIQTGYKAHVVYNYAVFFPIMQMSKGDKYVVKHLSPTLRFYILHNRNKIW